MVLRYEVFDLLACLFAFLITAIITLWWSGKGLFINGLIVAILLSTVEQYQQSQALAFEEE